MTTRFRYRAATPTGDLVEGVLQAASRPLALSELGRQRLYPVAVDEIAAARVERGARLGRRAAVALWTRSMATLLGAGVPLDRALAFSGAHAGHRGLSEVVREVRRSVQDGAGLADSLARHPRYFDALFDAAIAAGESSGALDAVLERLADHVEESRELRSQVQSALLYPVLMAIVASVGVIILLGFVIPRFATILADVGGKLPFSTRLLMTASQVVTKGWWAWLALGVTATYGIRAALARPDLRRRWHAARLQLPWLGDLERKYLTAGFTRTLGLLLRSGIPVVPALGIARASATNLVFREGIDQAVAAVTEGGALASALSGVLPPLAVQMIAVGEETSQLEALSLRVADAYDNEVRRALRAMVSLIEPTLILVFGAMVGFVALAMLQAIYGINLNRF
jgi:type II secretory pathway component PulF